MPTYGSWHDTKPEGLNKYEQKDLERNGLYRRLLAVRRSAKPMHVVWQHEHRPVGL